MGFRAPHLIYSQRHNPLLLTCTIQLEAILAGIQILPRQIQMARPPPRPVGIREERLRTRIQVVDGVEVAMVVASEDTPRTVVVVAICLRATHRVATCFRATHRVAICFRATHRETQDTLVTFTALRPGLTVTRFASS